MRVGAIVVDDLRSGQRTAIPMRFHQHGTAVTQVGWVDDTRLLVNGNATFGIAANLWRLRIDRDGQWSGPPEIWVESERDTAMWPNDVQGDRILVNRSRIAPSDFVIDGAARTGLASSGLRLVPYDLDRRHHRALVLNSEQNTWAWMSLDGAQVTPIPALEAAEQAVVSPHGLLAVESRADTSTVIAFDDRGRERGRLVLPWPSTFYPSVRCGATRCVVRWYSEHDAGAAVIEDDGPPTLGRLMRYAENTALSNTWLDWDVSPDGRWIAAPKVPTSVVMLYDLEHGEARRVVCRTCESVQQVRFTPDGGMLLASDLFSPARTTEEYVLVKRGLDGSEQVRLRSDQWIGKSLPIDDRKVLIHSLAYQRWISMLESQ
jgi:hypothetical protein